MWRKGTCALCAVRVSWGGVLAWCWGALPGCFSSSAQLSFKQPPLPLCSFPPTRCPRRPLRYYRPHLHLLHWSASGSNACPPHISPLLHAIKRPTSARAPSPTLPCSGSSGRATTPTQWLLSRFCWRVMHRRRLYVGHYCRFARRGVALSHRSLSPRCGTFVAPGEGLEGGGGRENEWNNAP